MNIFLKNNITIENNNNSIDERLENLSLTDGISGMVVGVSGLAIGGYLEAVGFMADPSNTVYVGTHILGGSLLFAYSLVQTMNSFKVIRNSKGKKKTKTIENFAKE